MSTESTAPEQFCAELSGRTLRALVDAAGFGSRALEVAACREYAQREARYIAERSRIARTGRGSLTLNGGKPK